MAEEQMKWSDGYRTHRVYPEGHLWRWTTTVTDAEGRETVQDLGLIPGGSFVEIERLRNEALHAVAAERAQIRSALIARGDNYMAICRERMAMGTDAARASALGYERAARALYDAADFLCAP